MKVVLIHLQYTLPQQVWIRYHSTPFLLLLHFVPGRGCHTLVLLYVHHPPDLQVIFLPKYLRPVF